MAKTDKKASFFEFYFVRQWWIFDSAFNGVETFQTGKIRTFSAKNKRICLSFLHSRQVWDEKMYKIGIDFLVIVL